MCIRDRVKKVNHPSLSNHPDHALYQRYFPNGAGSIFTFEVIGGQEEAHRFIDSLEIFSLLANVADVKSLVIHLSLIHIFRLNRILRFSKGKEARREKRKLNTHAALHA